MPSLSTYREHVEDVDVIVIGAGINGLATARESAALGMSVLLIDQDDIGSRTTAISTRLIHGGL
ncbi:FAD-dependent oxidoreductase, partial [Microbacterium sp.]